MEMFFVLARAHGGGAKKASAGKKRIPKVPTFICPGKRLRRGKYSGEFSGCRE